MALKEAGIRLTLAGAAEYRAGLKGISDEMRTMATESKLAVAQLGNNAKITDTYRAKVTNLGRQMEVSGQKTSLLQAQQKKLSDVYKDLPKRVTDASKAYEESSKETDRLRDSYQQMSKELGRNNEQTIQARQAWKDSADETKRLKTEYTELSGELGRTERELAKLPNELAKSELATQRLRNEAQRLHEEYRNNGGWAADYAKGLKDFGETAQRVAQPIKELGGFLTKTVTLPLVAMGGYALTSAMAWEQSFASVMKTNDEVYDSQGKLVYGYEQMESELRNLTSTLPVAHNDLAGIAENAGQLGIASQDVVGFTEVIAKLGRTTNLSYDEASTGLAKFLNVTGSGTDTVENLASSIVHLGNNTASTEREILTMGQRFAAVGSMMGLTDDQILGLSASMISLGVEVEAGSSAMQRFLLKTNDHVAEADEGLYLLAQTAGMTASEFATAWENDPITAIESFLVGLNEVDEAGGNVNDILKELGITSVNEVKALLSLAQGHEQLAEALGLAAEGYAENTALGEEFAVYAETTAAKVEILKNRIRDIAIEFGGPLAEALTSALDAAEPWIERLAEMAESFSSMDKEGQRNILMWLGIAAAAGPALSLLGNGISIIGRVSSALGTTVQTLGKWTTPKAIGETIDGLDKIPGSASAAGGASSLFTNPWIMGAATVTTAVAGIGYLIYKEATKYDASHRESVKETEGAYQTWFDAVVAGSVTAADAQNQIQSATEQTGETYREVADRIKRQNHEIQQRIDEMWEGSIGYQSRMTGQVEYARVGFKNLLRDMMSPEDINYLEGQYNDLGVMLTNTLTDIGVAYNNNRVVTAEWAISQVDNMNNVREAVVSNLQLQRDALIQTATKEAEYHQNSEQWLAQETARIEQQYEHRVGVANRATATITEILQNAAKNNATITDDEMVSMVRSIQDFAKVSGQSLTELGEAGELVGEALRGLATDAGLDFLEMRGVIDSETAAMIRSMADAEDRTNALWDALSQYEQYEPSMKILDIDAEQAMADIQAAIEAGATWEEFSPEEKVFMMQTMGEEAVKLLLATIGIDWNTLTPEEKELIASVESAEDVEEVIHQLGDWNTLSLEDKILNLEAQVANDNLLEVIRNQDLWNNSEFYAQFIAIDTNAPDAEEQIVALVSAYTGIPEEEIRTLMFETNATETAGELKVVSSRVEEINGQQVIIHTMSDGTEVTQAELEETVFIAHSIDGTNVGITMGQTGAEETRGSIEGVGHSLGEVPESKTTSLTSNLFGMVANLLTIGLYNTAVDSMRDITVTAEANASTVSSATPEIDAYNQSAGAMTDTSATASTATPGLPGDTNLVDDWNSSTGSMANASSTASTSTPSIGSNTNAVWSWISALDSTYNTSSTLTTYVDTVYRTLGSPTRRFAEGGHIDAFADGGNIQWAGGFASGGNVPPGFMGIVGEAGPELFHVTKKGVSITPLSPNEKMRGVEGAIADFMQGKGGGGDTYQISINVDKPTVSEPADLRALERSLTRAVDKAIGKVTQNKKKGWVI